MFYKPFDHGEKRQTEAWPWSNMVSVFNRGWPFDHGRLWSTMLLSHTFILSPFNKNYIFFFKVPKYTFKWNVSKVIYHSYYKNRKIYELVWHNKKFIITTKYLLSFPIRNQILPDIICNKLIHLQLEPMVIDHGPRPWLTMLQNHGHWPSSANYQITMGPLTMNYPGRPWTIMVVHGFKPFILPWTTMVDHVWLKDTMAFHVLPTMVDHGLWVTMETMVFIDHG